MGTSYREPAGLAIELRMCLLGKWRLMFTAGAVVVSNMAAAHYTVTLQKNLKIKCSYNWTSLYQRIDVFCHF